jgi:hypothetical protein
MVKSPVSDSFRHDWKPVDVVAARDPRSCAPQPKTYPDRVPMMK